MKNTTFRKKALLSSVAMLLVALVALGSATFAWFTQNPTVNAEGLTLHAKAGAGLQILSSTANAAGADFAPDTVINAEKSGTDIVTKGTTPIGSPVSIDLDVTEAITFRTTTADSETFYGIERDDENHITGTITGGTAGYSEDIYLRSSIDGADAVVVNSVKVTMLQANEQNSTNPAEGKLYNAIRVTIADGATILGTWSPDGVANDYLTTTGPKSSATFTTMGTAKTGLNMSVPYATKDDLSEAKALKLYVWLDGEDTACFTANVENLKDLVKSINVEFSL